MPPKEIPNLARQVFCLSPDGLLLRYDRYGKTSPVRVYKNRRKDGTKYYPKIRFGGKQYQYHRVVWFLDTGRNPDCQIDHRDRDPWNPCLENLREAMGTLNSGNTKQTKRKSKLPGVQFRKETGKWTAKIKFNRKSKWLGSFDSLDSAAHAYVEEHKKLYGEFSIFVTEPSYLSQLLKDMKG